MRKNIIYSILCFLGSTVSLYSMSSKVSSLEKLVPTIEHALSDDEQLIQVRTKKASFIESLKQTLLETQKLPLIAIFKDYFVKVLQGHTQVISIAFSFDGTKALTGSCDTTARLWDIATGNSIATLQGHTGPIYVVAFSPDGTKALTGSWDHTACLWDVATGNLIATLQGHTTPISSVAFSPDGTKAVTGSWDSTARLWDAATGNQLTILQQSHDTEFVGPIALTFSKDSTKILARPSLASAWFCDEATGSVAATLEGRDSNAIDLVGLTPDSINALTGSSNNTAWPLNGVLGKLISTLSFSPGGGNIVFTNLPIKKVACLWDMATGNLIATLQGRTRSLLRGGAYYRLSSDNKYILLSSPDGIRLGDFTKQQPTSCILTDTDGILHAGFTPNSKYAITYSGHILRLWDLSEPMASLTLAQLLIVLKLKQDPQEINNESYRTIYETIKPEIKNYLQETLNLQVSSSKLDQPFSSSNLNYDWLLSEIFRKSRLYTPAFTAESEVHQLLSLDKAASKIQRAFKLFLAKPKCAICLKRDTDVLTACKHRYHSDCLVEWLKVSDTCPICRNQIIT
jgi:WD40 repeat protein